MEAEIRQTAVSLLENLGLKGDELEAASASVSQTKIAVPSEGPFIPTPFKVTNVISALNVAVLALCNSISKQRLGREQQCAVDAELATASMSSHFAYKVDDLPPAPSIGVLAQANPPSTPDPWAAWRGLVGSHFRCADGLYIVMLTRPLDTPHKLLAALGFDEKETEEMVGLLATKEGRLEHVKRMMAKILTWNSFELEARIISLNATAAIVGRSQENFLASEHGKIASTWPFVEVVPAPVSTPEQSWPAVPWSKITKPGVHGILHGVKVVELTRILLGPRTGCLLAALGASVVRINSPRIAEGMLAVDVNVGHLSFHLDLRNPEDKAKLDTLLEDCDVFISNNTPGVVDKLGLSLNDLLKKISGRNKGLVYAEANAFGHAGPYAKASGYEQLGQFISGLADTHGKYHKYDGPVEEDRPALVPINVLDICTAHLFGMGIIRALSLRALHGSSYRVRTSLLQGAMTLQSLVLYPKETVDKIWSRYEPEPTALDPDRPFGGGSIGWFCAFQCVQFTSRYPSAFKREYYQAIKGSPWLADRSKVLSILAPGLSMSETPVRYRLSSRPMGWDHEVRWPDLEEGGELVEGEGRVWEFVAGRA